VAQDQHQPLARAQAIEQIVKAAERVAALRVHHHQLLVRNVTRFRQCQPAPRAPAAQLPFDDADRERDDEAAQRLRLAQGADAREQPVEDLLRDVLDLGVRSDGAADDPVHERRVAIPRHLGGVRSTGDQRARKLEVLRVLRCLRRRGDEAHPV
jgi:chromosome condensin MukBEF ATPase and DNA-binding subunit MukB